MMVLLLLIIYLIIGMFTMSLFWNYICDHEDTDCDVGCWCAGLLGYVTRILAWTGILSWGILSIVWIILFVYKEMRKYARKVRKM